MDMKEIKKLKAETDEFICETLKTFEAETGLEVVAILIDRRDITQMGDERKTQLMGVEIQAMLEPVVETEARQ
jgi:hypothetical protein